MTNKTRIAIIGGTAGLLDALALIASKENIQIVTVDSVNDLEKLEESVDPPDVLELLVRPAIDDFDFQVDHCITKKTRDYPVNSKAIFKGKPLPQRNISCKRSVRFRHQY